MGIRGRYLGIRSAIDGMYCETDDIPKAIDGTLKAIDRIRKPIDGFQCEMRGARKAIDGAARAIPWLSEPDRWYSV